jgi:GNAT superfamily N-acetyltransferase
MLRPANPADAAALTDLAMRAKAYWGYDAAFMEACRPELTISPNYIQNCVVRAMDSGDGPVGFYSLEPHGAEVELVHLFVDPAALGRGHGKRLWANAVDTARALGYVAMLITSDPFAEGFYLAMGAGRIGEIASSVRPGRELPLLRFEL